MADWTVKLLDGRGDRCPYPRSFPHSISRSTARKLQADGQIQLREGLEVSASCRLPSICREWNMWLALTAIVLAAAIGFNVLAVAIQHYD
jgi:hypothetical protein